MGVKGMGKLKIRHICLTLCLMMIISSQEMVFAGNAKSSSSEDFKVIGYYCGEWFDVPVSSLQADKLTHIMYGFLIPKEDGTCKPFEEEDELKALIEKGHNVGTEVYISLGGYSEKNGPPLKGVFEKISASDKLRNIFIENVMEVVEKYGFDGVEIDWEYATYKTAGDYEKLITGFYEKLHPIGKGLSTALPGTGSINGENVWEALSAVSDKCLSSFDFISLMCYDLNLTRDDNHSPIWFANTTINYWTNIRNVPREKVILGMPLYARPSWQQYRFLVAMDKENAYRDYAATPPTESTYNGLNTLREKTMIALRRAGGVMLFDVNEDTYDETSVVSMIDETLKAMEGKTRDEINDYITVVIDNKVVDFSQGDGYGAAFVDENNRTLAPMRKLLMAMPAKAINWNNEARSVNAVKDRENGTSSKDPIDVTVKIGERYITVDGKRRAMDTQAIIKDGRTYLPARALLEAFEYEVTWSNEGKTIYAVSK